MEQYIPKSVVLAEIKRLRKAHSGKHGCDEVGLNLEYLEDFLDTLEGKEVDLDKEIENILEKEKVFVTENREVKYYNGDSFNHIYELEFIAKHFFELGLNVAQKGE